MTFHSPARVLLERVQVAIARGASTFDVMRIFNVSYEYVYAVRHPDERITLEEIEEAS